MPQWSVRLLGQFQVQHNGQPITTFKTDKARALLAYLAVEAGRPHQRAALAGLFWPEWPEPLARTYVRQALANLQQALADEQVTRPFLVTTRQTIQWQPHPEVWLDVTELTRALAGLSALTVEQANPNQVARLAAAVALYRGRLLEGFFIEGCAQFEEWQLLTGEQLQRQVVAALQWLAHWYERHGELDQAQQAVWRCTELEPLLDAPHHHLMRLLALTGEASAALAHYEQYQRLLAEALAIKPPSETTELAAQLRAGQFLVTQPPRLGPTPTPLVLPPFLTLPPPPSPSLPLVAREQELALLKRQLQAALIGRGGVGFIVGEAGQGKTALLRAFVHQAVQTHEGLLVVGSNCSSYNGRGDPLLPFREILAQLTGDLEAAWTAGTLERRQAQHLWANFPFVVQTLLVDGPDLIDTLLPLPSLQARVALLPGGAAWQPQLEACGQRPPKPPATDGAPTFPPSSALFAQVTKVLQVVTRQAPLFLWLDDLHWADLDSLALLFHLGQHLAGCRLFIVGTYRPEELALATPEQPHPLVRVVEELQLRSGHQLVNLNATEGRTFVQAYLDTEPNRLGPAFRERLYQLSGGQPLFTIELLQSLQERQALIRDDTGYWVEGTAFDWAALPVRISAVIGQRLRRLPAALQRLLTIASVQGEQFSAELMAAVLGQPVHDLLPALSGELERHYQLVKAEGVRRYGDKRLTSYRFRHILFQKYLLDQLDPIERVHSHEALAQALESFYQDLAGELPAIAAQLAWHYEQAALPRPALRYHLIASQWALQLSAVQEALAHLQQGRALLAQCSEEQPHTALEVDLLTQLSVVQAMLYGSGSTAVAQTLDQIAQLDAQSALPPVLFQVRWSRWEQHFQRGEIRPALKVGEQCLHLAEQLQQPLLLAEAHNALGATLYRLGQMATAQQQLAKATVLADGQRLAGLRYAHGLDLGVSSRVNEAITLWYLGYGDQAQQRLAEGLRLAEANGHEYSLVFALIFATGLAQRCNAVEQTLAYSSRAIRLSTEQKFTMWAASGQLYLSWAHIVQGDLQNGLTAAVQSWQALQKTGLHHLRYGAILVDAYARAGRIIEALTLLNELLVTAQRTEEREWTAEMHRLKGALLLQRDAHSEKKAETCFLQAITLARQQAAKMLELRAVTSLSRLYQTQGRLTEAYQPLAQLYEWFTEGFALPDLREARTLLLALENVPS